MPKNKILVFILIILLTLICLFAYYSHLKKFQITQEQVYSSQSECEQATHKFCEYISCDYIPEGQSVEQVCGSQTAKGFYPTQADFFNPISKIYNSSNQYLSFSYPEKLTVTEYGDIITIKHYIDYPNNGECDLSGDPQPSKTLKDFKVSLQTFTNINIPKNAESINLGKYKAYYIDNTTEGCGDKQYYISLSNNQTLVITKDNIQATSGISTQWNLAEILKVPGAISAPESEQIFHQILDNLNFADNTNKNLKWSACKMLSI